MVHQMSRITTITVVIAMICSAFWLDSCMPWVFFHQKYATTMTANPAAKVVVGKMQRAVQVRANVLDETRKILARGNGADGAGQDVVEKQRRDRKLGQGSAHGLLDDAVDAATDEHAAGFDVERPHGSS